MNKKTANRHSWIHILLLLGWITSAIALRFNHLSLKPASSIEIATLGFSLGNGFAQIPIDRLVSVSTLLAPLRFDPTVSVGEITNILFRESTHPPLYFWLTHWWTKLFVSPGELVSLEIGRSLSAILGAMAVPGMFGLGWLAFRSRWVAHLSAALMAVSPYSIYLSQEARHYTLSILWIIASLSCCVVATRCIEERTRIPLLVALIWIVVNGLGVATHFFFVLALAAEGVAIAGLWLAERRHQIANTLHFYYWWRIYAVAIATLVNCLIWLPIYRSISDNELTGWIKTSWELNEVLLPIPRLIAWLITMVMLLPLEGTPSIVTIISALIMVLLLALAVPVLIRGWRSQISDPIMNLPLLVIGGYCIGAIVMFLLLIYGLQRDISLAPRYQFIYFPAVIILIAVALAENWQDLNPITVNAQRRKAIALGRRVTVAILIIGSLGSISVANNFGFQKSRQSDRLAAHILATSKLPAIVVMTYQTYSQRREMVALALSFERLRSRGKLATTDSSPELPQFALIEQEKDGVDYTLYTLDAILATQPRPIDLWAIDLQAGQNVLRTHLDCYLDPGASLENSGYRDLLYHCGDRS